MEVVTGTQPSERQWEDMLFAWTVVRQASFASAVASLTSACAALLSRSRNSVGGPCSTETRSVAMRPRRRSMSTMGSSENAARAVSDASTPVL